MVPAIDHSKKDGGMYIFPESNAGIKACVEIEYPIRASNRDVIEHAGNLHLHEKCKTQWKKIWVRKKTMHSRKKCVYF
jgi:ribosomal protein L24